MRAAIAMGVVTATLVLSGSALAEHRRGGVWIGFGFSRSDYYHDHDLDCGCRERCHYYGGVHHYSHRHRHDRHRHYDSRRYGDYRYGDYGDPYYHEGRYAEDYDPNEYRSRYWHEHYAGDGRYVRCRVDRGVHYFGRW